MNTQSRQERYRKTIAKVIETNPNAGKWKMISLIENERSKKESYGEFRNWKKEVDLQLDSHFGNLGDADLESLFIIHEWKYSPYPRALHFYLDIACGGCAQKSKHSQTKGCILCAPKHTLIDRLFATADFTNLLAQLRSDLSQIFLLGVISDWCREKGYEEVAECFRLEFEKKSKEVPA